PRDPLDPPTELARAGRCPLIQDDWAHIASSVARRDARSILRADGHVRPLSYAVNHETGPAAAPSPPLGRRPERRWPQAEVRAQLLVSPREALHAIRYVLDN